MFSVRLIKAWWRRRKYASDQNLEFLRFSAVIGGRPKLTELVANQATLVSLPKSTDYCASERIVDGHRGGHLKLRRVLRGFRPGEVRQPCIYRDRGSLFQNPGVNTDSVFASLVSSGCARLILCDTGRYSGRGICQTSTMRGQRTPPTWRRPAGTVTVSEQSLCITMPPRSSERVSRAGTCLGDGQQPHW